LLQHFLCYETATICVVKYFQATLCVVKPFKSPYPTKEEKEKLWYSVLDGRGPHPPGLFKSNLFFSLFSSLELLPKIEFHAGRRTKFAPVKSLDSSVTPIAGLIFETKNRAIFLERFFWRDFSGAALLPVELCSH